MYVSKLFILLQILTNTMDVMVINKIKYSFKIL
jgi:hypothetical protein